ncbi:MAG: hypothetical protein ACLTDV_11820 [Eubacterium sp.]
MPLIPTKGCLALFTGMIYTNEFQQRTYGKSARRTDLPMPQTRADYLVNHGVPFRDAHGIVGRLVLHCIDRRNIALMI